MDTISECLLWVKHIAKHIEQIISMLTIIAWSRHHPQFTDENTEAQKPCSGIPNNYMTTCSEDILSVFLKSNFKFLTFVSAFRSIKNPLCPAPLTGQCLLQTRGFVPKCFLQAWDWTRRGAWLSSLPQPVLRPRPTPVAGSLIETNHFFLRKQ